MNAPPLTDADRLLYSYCGRDCCVTWEVNEVMEKRLMPGQRRHYQFNMSLLAPLLYMELRGMRYDYEKAKTKLKRVQRWANVIQDLLDRAGGRGVPGAHQGKDKGLQVRRDTVSAHQRKEPIRGESGGGDLSATALLSCRDAAAKHESDSQGVEGAAQEGEVSVQPGVDPLIALIARQLCLAKPRRREEVTTTRTFKNGKTKTTTKTVSRPVEIRTLADCREFAKESCKVEMRRVSALLGRGYQGPANRGELSVLLDQHVAVNSTGNTGDACWFLYERCGFARHYQKEGNRLTTRLSSDDETLIKIWVEEEKKPQPWAHGGVRVKHRGRLALAFLKLRRLLTQTRTLRVAPDADGRMRCAYNLVGTETGRLTCYESPTGSGYNLQTVTKPHRDMFLADEGCLLGQCDLSGADGWTVAAYAAAQGDRTMLEDYRAGLKPTKITVLMQTHGRELNKKSRDTIKEMCRQVDSDGWLYFAHKQVVYGGAYGMGGKTMSDGILTKSWKRSGKPIFVPPKECERIQQDCFFTRYWGIPRWHSWMAGEIRAHGCLVASNGFKRMFFGRKDDHATVKQALAHLPQVYTTYGTMLALGGMWGDQENRLADGRLRVEPLHTVHDSIVDQFKAEDREWAVGKHKEWFANPMLIAQETVTIPYEMGIGVDWKDMK